jgi:2'-5' RNA ligase
LWRGIVRNKNMEYAITLYFDEKTEEIINSLIKKIANKTGNKYMVDNKIPPHITISLFQYNGKIDTVMGIIENNISLFNRKNIVIASIGIFNPSVLFIAPVINDYLIELNRKVNEIININDEILLDRNYIKNQWIPHISLGVKLNEKELINGVKTLVKNFKILDIGIDRVGFAKCNPYKDIKIWKI